MRENDAQRDDRTLGRRDFIKEASLGALGAGLTISGLEGAFAEDGGAGIPGRRLGRTGLQVSEISMGAAGLSEPAVLNAAIDRGVTYVDTAPTYGNSEEVIGQVMPRRRDDIVLATKWHPQSEKTRAELLESLDTSLRRLQTDHVDVIQVHGAGGPSGSDRLRNTEMLEAFRIARQQGKARFLGCTSHAGNRTEVLCYAIKSGHFDVILVSMDYSTYEDAGIHQLLALAKQHDVGVVAMKVQQGKAAVEGITDGPVSVRQANLKWSLSRDISTVVSGMHTFSTMKEDLGAAGKGTSMRDRAVLEQYAAAVTHDYCRMCDRCLPCPEGVAISTVLRYAMYHKHYGQPHQATGMYRELGPRESAAACADCGECEERCTFGLPVVAKLREAEQLMGSVA